MPAKHNEKTRELFKRTSESYAEQIAIFKEECQTRLEERLKHYDQRLSEVTHSPKKKPVPAETSAAKPEASAEKNVVADKPEEAEEENYGEDDFINEIYNMN